ncbi:MAG: hypothetical protein KME16_07685 [Scytolyngbya sp. HA4215-MV1]|jgi:hypothetical protein|nr:hypothetical protein [Scytolyngbya sp. HA4215-MV1]
MSAVLFDRRQQHLYPIAWQATDATSPSAPSLTQTFRFPTVGYLAADQLVVDASPQPPAAIGLAALALAVKQQSLAPPMESPIGTAQPSGQLFSHFKQCLKIGLLAAVPPDRQVESALQWSDQRELPIDWVQQVLQALLATVTPAQIAQTANHAETRDSHPTTSICVEGLAPETLQRALSHLAGVILGYPGNSSDTYQFNLREAVLAVGLVDRPEKIFLIEDAIAALLPDLATAKASIPLPLSRLGQQRRVYGADSVQYAPWQGGTLVIDAGADRTDLLLVNLPTNLQTLTYTDFSLRSLAYAGNAIDQDIVCHLLAPQCSPETNPLNSGSEPAREAGYLFHPAVTLPLPADPDPRTRYRLQQRLAGSTLGQNLLTAARHLKRVLMQQDTFTFELSGQHWSVRQSELETRILQPFIQRLNRELNALMTYTGLSTEAIQQVICVGDTAQFPVIIHWLQQKMLNAIILQDAQPDSVPGLSRVACGLALFPLFPQVLDVPRQQYSDYFLLLELLRIPPEQYLPLGKILQLMESGGINIRTCQFRILSLLEGHLPIGLVPSQSEAALLTNESRQNPIYRTLTTEPLFTKEAPQIYRLNREQRDRLYHHLSQLLANAYQSLEDPLTFDLSHMGLGTIGEGHICQP